MELPSIFTNVRNKDVMDWISEETADGKYCERRTGGGNNPPHIEIRNLPDLSSQTASVEESAGPGEIVSSIFVTDADQGESGETLLTIIQRNEAGHFTLDSRGVVRVAGRGLLDRETTSQYQLTVQAEDRGSPSRTSTATLVINVKPRPVKVIPGVIGSISKSIKIASDQDKEDKDNNVKPKQDPGLIFFPGRDI